MVSGGRKALIFLPPLDGPVELYRDRATGRNEKRSFEWEFGEFGNDLWLSMAARYPHHIVCIDLTGQIAPENMADSNHYHPSVLRSMAGMVDDWYAQQKGEAIDAVPGDRDVRGLSDGERIAWQPDRSEIVETENAADASLAGGDLGGSPDGDRIPLQPDLSELANLVA